MFAGIFTQDASGSFTNTLTVSGFAQDGRPLHMWITLESSDGSMAKSGYTPLIIDLAATGITYTVLAHDYSGGSIYFDHWDDGTKNKARTVQWDAVNNNDSAKMMAAYYRTSAITVTRPSSSAHNLTVMSVDLNGKILNGYYTTIKSIEGSTQSTTIVKTGFTPLSFAGNKGALYAITVAGYGDKAFDHWQDGSATRPKIMTLDTNTTITAYLKTKAPPNSSPSAANDTVVTGQGIPVELNVLANDSDPDGDSLTITSVSNSSNGSMATGVNGTITYVPNLGFAGTDAFSYTISDNKGGTDTARVDVTVQPAPALNPVILFSGSNVTRNVPMQIAYSGFQPGEEIKRWITPESTGVSTEILPAVSANDQGFVLTEYLPIDLGRHGVTAIGQTSGAIASGQFIVHSP